MLVLVPMVVNQCKPVNFFQVDFSECGIEEIGPKFLVFGPLIDLRMQVCDTGLRSRRRLQYLWRRGKFKSLRGECRQLGKIHISCMNTTLKTAQCPHIVTV